ncbi:hypothetical protein [Fundidesulfovibrio soli]|uniref:hypothetical protein n=1 Tax=Fundidesulfovibrio soli TaxID=2922716 RepID=UPI001FAF7E6A|nr:hypothetical protein [Fundidesulfovibrio soli]
MKYALILTFFLLIPPYAYALDLVPLEACTLMDDVLDSKGHPWRVDSNSGGCGTTYQNLPSQGVIKSNVAYYANGDSSSAKQLKIILNINDTSTADHNIQTFKHYCGKLYMKLIKKPWSMEFSKEFDKTTRDGIQRSWKVNEIDFILLKKIWPTGKGYELQFIVE